jgi:hypothetical protein
MSLTEAAMLIKRVSGDPAVGVSAGPENVALVVVLSKVDVWKSQSNVLAGVSKVAVLASCVFKETGGVSMPVSLAAALAMGC